MTVALVVPQNWPMAWWGPGSELVRMSCPACGHFSLYFDRSNCKPKLSCTECGINGIPAVIEAFARWRQEVAADAAAMELAKSETNVALSIAARRGIQKKAANQ